MLDERRGSRALGRIGRRLALSLLAAVAGCAGDPTGARLEVRFEASWQLDRIGLAVGDQAVSVTPAAEVLVLVPDAWAGMPLAIAGTGFRGDATVATGVVEVTPVQGQVATAILVLTPATCETVCEPGQTACADGGVETCALRAGCTAWTAPVACGSEAPFCSAGLCTASCAGTCEPQPWTTDIVDGVVLDATHVYWADLVDHTLMRRPREGGAEAPVAIHSGVIENLASDATHLYWVDRAAVRRVEKAGGPIETVWTAIAPDYDVSEIAVDDTHIYWINEIDTSPDDVAVVRRRAKSGGTVETISDGRRSVVGLGIDATHVYWSERLALWRRAKAGGATQRVAALSGFYSSIAFDRTHIYLTQYWENEVTRVPRAGGPPESVATGQGGPGFIAVDAGHVYWANRLDGRVMRWAKTGGTTAPIATDQAGPLHLAIDDDHVYWGVGGAGGLLRLSRCACGL